jgi:hypothetical protein
VHNDSSYLLRGHEDRERDLRYGLQTSGFCYEPIDRLDRTQMRFTWCSSVEGRWGLSSGFVPLMRSCLVLVMLFLT